MSYVNGEASPVEEELKKLGKEVNSALITLREATETNNKETLGKVQKFWDDYHAKNSEFAKEYALTQKTLKDQAEQIEEAKKALAESKKGTAEYEIRTKALELAFATQGQKKSEDEGQAKRDNPEYKAFMHVLSGGQAREFKSFMNKNGMIPALWDPSALDLKTLRTDSESAGGYLIPQVMDSQIRKNIVEMSPVRAHAKVRTMPGKTMDVPRRLSVPLAQFEGETEAAPTDQSIYGSEQVTAYRQTVKVPATLDMMVSSAFDLEREIAGDVGESFAQGEGLNFVSGNGRKSPQGFTSDTRVVGYTSTNSAAIIYDDLPKMAGGLKRGQSPWWYFNRVTLGYLQNLKSSIGVPLWAPMAGGAPATILGWPYSSDMIDMANATGGSSAKPVAFADLYRGYEIFDMVGMNVVRDDLTKADQAITQWIFRRYLTGRVILPEAISVMTLA
jgi:HK97 family phage major capsid protein